MISKISASLFCTVYLYWTLIFDKSVYRTSWEEIVNNEIFRQRDKSNNNDIGYFHQNIFSYFKGCEVPTAGWDVIYRNADGMQYYVFKWEKTVKYL